MFSENNKNGLVYMTSSVITARHLFTTRYGGVSTGDFASLNLGSNRGDPQENVAENYRRVAAFFGVGRDDCAVTKQVHGNEVRVVTGADKHVCGSKTPYEADGLVTTEHGLPIFCFVADCVPALLCDAEHGVIAAVHCGWRSSVADILGVTVEKMCALGAEPESICAAMGASIGRCCFETDDDVPDAVKNIWAVTRRSSSTAARAAKRWSISARRTPCACGSSACGRRISTYPMSARCAAMRNTGRTAIPSAWGRAEAASPPA